MQIRKMIEEDIEDISKLEQICFSMPWSKAAFQKALHQPEVLFLVAKENEKVVGYVGMYIAVDEGNITNMAVAPEHRKKQIGAGLLETLLKEAADRKIQQIFLEVRQGNLPARKLYQKIGFMEIGQRKNFYDKPREDAVLMKKDLL